MHTILNIRFAYLFFIIAILFLRVPYFQTMTIKGDEGYFLMMGDLLIQGKKLYVDFLSLNSPLTCFFYIIPNLFPKDIIYSRIICSILIFITSLLLFHISENLFFLTSPKVCLASLSKQQGTIPPFTVITALLHIRQQ